MVKLDIEPGPSNNDSNNENENENDKENRGLCTPNMADDSAVRQYAFVAGKVLTPIKQIPSVRGTIGQMVLSPDGKSVSVLYNENLFRRYDIQTWELLEEKTLPSSRSNFEDGNESYQFGDDGFLYGYIHHQEVKQLARFSADGTVESLQNMTFPTNLSGMVLSPDASMAFVTGDKNTGQLYTNDSSSPVDFQFTNKRYDAMWPTFSPDGSWIALTDTHSVLHVINIKTKEVTDFPMPKLDAYPIGWLPDGQTLIVGRKNEVVFLYLPNGEISRTFTTKRGFARNAQISPDGRRMSFQFSSTRNEGTWTLRVLDLETMQSLDNVHQPLPNAFDSHSMWLPDGRLVCVHTEWTILDQSLQPIHTFDGIPGKWDIVAFLNKSTFAAIDADQFRLFDSQSGQETARYADLYLKDPYLFDDGHTLLGTCNDTALLYDLTKHKRIAKIPLWMSNDGLVLSPQYDLLFGGDEEHNIVYSLPSGKKRFEFTCQEGKHCYTVFSPDGKLILSRDDFQIVLIDTTTGQTVHSRCWPQSFDNRLKGGDFFPDGKQFYVAGRNTITVFDTATTGELYHKDFAPPTDEFAFPDIPTPKQDDFSPDGRFFIAGGGMGSPSFTIFDAKTFEIYRSYRLDIDYSMVVPDLLRQRIYIVSADCRFIEVIQTTDFNKVVSFGPFDADIFSLRLFDNGRKFVVGFRSEDRIEFFRADDFSSLGRVNLPNRSNHIYHFFDSPVFSPDGRHFICMSQLNGVGSTTGVLDLYELGSIVEKRE